MLMLAQAAEQVGDLQAAESWLNQIDSPQRALEVQLRRASLLNRQGRLAEALALVRAAPEANEDEARSKVLAEVQLLRENKLWQQADQALDKANLRFVKLQQNSTAKCKVLNSKQKIAWLLPVQKFCYTR